MRPAFCSERSVMRRHELHVRPSAHEADELLLLHSAVETDENRTRIVRVQTGCSPVELQPQIFATTSRCGYRGSHTDLELGTLASCYWTMAAESPSSELHRSLPFTKRLLDFRAARAKETRERDQRAQRPRLQRKDSNLHLSD